MAATTRIKPFLTADRVILGFAADSRDDVLRQLAQPLADAGILDDIDRFVEDLTRREAQMTTVMDNGVALPHARSHAVRRLGLAVGISGAGGIRFSDDPEAAPAQLFFCIAIPSFAPTCHMPLLQSLARFSREPKRVSKLLSSKTQAVAARYLGSYKG